jgi:hypothetical protein
LSLLSPSLLSLPLVTLLLPLRTKPPAAAAAAVFAAVCRFRHRVQPPDPVEAALLHAC